MLLNVVLKSHEKAILVGSSMGAWIALHVALRHPGKVTGIVGVASGIDFTESLYNSASGKQKTDWKTTGFAHFPSQYEAEPFPISCNFIRDAQETWLLLDKSSIPITCPVRLLHGQNDNDVSWQVSMKLNNLLESNNVVLILIKDGDHRLSRPQDLERMVACLDELLTLNNETRI
jgi:pimeloyl-ACP methyl ester carboxylesterase